MLNKILSHWNRLPDSVKRIAHTFWQSFAAVLVVGLSGLSQVHSVSDAKTAAVALLTAAVAAGLSAVKARVVRG